MDLRIDGTAADASLDDGELPEALAAAIEAALGRMKDSPGDVNEVINLTLVNDFEAEDDEESEDEESDDAAETQNKE
jgi:hypothetical protein